VNDERFATTVECLRPHILELRAEHPDSGLTFFDAVTATALLLFQDAATEFAIIEAGLGGRLDATNVVEPEVACITSIELEHVDKLGNTLEEIAREKAAIIKPGIPTVTGNLPPVAASEVLDRAKAMGAPLVRLYRELEVRFLSKDIEGFEVSLRLGNLHVNKIELPLLGQHAVENGAIAAACVYLLDSIPVRDLARAIRDGLASARLPGRIEVVAYQPWVVVDSAHTESSAQALAAVLERIPARRAHLVLSISSGKNLKAICQALLPDFEMVTATVAQPGRSLPPETLAATIAGLRPNVRLNLVTDPVEAVLGAYRALSSDDLLCIAGSVYMAGRAHEALAEAMGS
jgi:dihydrofolate synthase/folylpolyglutamate synthase